MISPIEYDARFDEKLAIIRSVKEPLEQVTVSDICKRVGISRNRFYRLFSTKEEMFHWLIGYYFAISLDEVGKSLTWQEGIEAYLTAANDDRSFILNASLGLIEKPKLLRLPFETSRASTIVKTLTEYKRREISPALQLEIQTYVVAEENLSRQWLAPNDFTDMAKYAQTWADCVPRNLYEALELKR